MSHDCEDCGQTVETVIRLRLHDYPGYDTTAVADHIHDAEQGDPAAVRHAITEYETALQSAVETDSSGEMYREIFWDYYEPLAEALDGVVQAEGWPFLAEMIEAFDPGEREDVPFANAVIENVVGRFLIRTRLTDGVEAIPPDAVAYLNTILHRTAGDIARARNRSPMAGGSVIRSTLCQSRWPRQSTTTGSGGKRSSNMPSTPTSTRRLTS